MIMPVVDRQQERALVERARQRGMNNDQIKAAVTAFRSQAQPAQAPAPQGPGFLASLAKPFTKAASSIQGVVEGVGELGAAGLSKLTGNDQGYQQHLNQAQAATTAERNYGVFGKARPIGVNQDTGQNLSVGRGIGDILGTGAEIASYAAPVGAAEGAVTAAKAAPSLLSKIGSVAAQGAKFGAVGGGLAAGGSELAKPTSSVGSVALNTLGGAAAGGVIGGAIPGVGTAVGTVSKAAHEAVTPFISKYGGKALAEGAGKLAGVGEAPIAEAFRNPEVINYIRQSGGDVQKLQTDALDMATKGLRQLRETRSTEYVSQLNKIKQDTTRLDSEFGKLRADATRRLTDPHEGYGVGLIDAGTPNERLDFSKSTIVNQTHQSVLQRAYQDVQHWQDTSPAGLDALKKRLYQVRDNIPVTESGGARSFVTNLAKGVDDTLKNNVKDYAIMTKGYREASDLIDEVERSLSLKDSASQDTAIRKLASVMRQNNELRLSLIKQLEGTGVGDITGRLAAAQMAPAMPRGLAGTFIGPVAAFSIGNLPGTLLYLAASSPRLLAEFLNVIGQISRSTPGEVPKLLQMKVRRILNEASKDAQKLLRSGAAKSATD